MRADAQTEAAVANAFKRLWDAYAARDGGALLSMFVPDPDVVLYGTGADEKRVGLAQIKMRFERDWSQSEAASLTFDWHAVSAVDGLALVAADGAVHAEVQGEDVTMPVRVTTVYAQRENKWLVAQMHVSMPAGEQAEGESFTPGTAP